MLTPSLTTSANLSLPKASRALPEFNNTFTATLAAQAASHAEPSQLTQQPSIHISADSDKSAAGYAALINKTGSPTAATNEEEKLYRPDELRYGRKRPDLPLTFGFGIKRFTTVPLAMRFSLIEGKAPDTAQQAVAAQLDIAATNSLPYTKGKQLNIYT